MKIRILLVLFVLNFNAKSADFEKAFATTIKHEGIAFTAFHYDNDGGGTKFGFTLKRYQQIAKKEGIKGYDNDNDGIITKNDLRLMNMGKVKELYKKNYWDVLGCDLIESQLTAESMYDYLVNGGFSLRKLQSFVGVESNGRLSIETIKAINNKGECKVSQKIIKDRGEWLFIVMKRTRPATYANCKKGWANRVNTYIKQFKQKKCNEKLDYFIV